MYFIDKKLIMIEFIRVLTSYYTGINMIFFLIDIDMFMLH